MTMTAGGGSIFNRAIISSPVAERPTRRMGAEGGCFIRRLLYSAANYLLFQLSIFGQMPLTRLHDAHNLCPQYSFRFAHVQRQICRALQAALRNRAWDNVAAC